MKIRCVWEHNGNDSILYADNFIGAFTRGALMETAIQKMPSEIKSWLTWKGDVIPDSFEPEIVQEKSCLPNRTTFYGQIPRTAFEMYEHTKNVNRYYFGEIGVCADNEGSIAECRERGFALLERQPDFLRNRVYHGTYAEEWSLRKVLRRFVWHDRIHAKAMYRMAIKTFGVDAVPNVFSFQV